MRSSVAPPSTRSPLEVVLTDETAFRAWYEATLPRVYRYLFNRCGRDHALAEELTQETFVEAIRSLHRASGGGDEIGWMIGIARHRLADHYRSLARQERGFLALVTNSQPETDSSWPQFDDDLLDALGGLPAMQRAAIVLRYVDDLPVRDVARLLRHTEKATESLLSRGRTALRDALGEQKND